MINRREFMIGASGMMLSMVTDERQQTTPLREAAPNTLHAHARVSIIKTPDRSYGVKRSIDLLDINPIRGKEVLLKPNFNSADAFPGSTHNDTLLNLIKHLKTMGAKSITLGERCGPGSTARVLKEKGINELCEKENVRIVNFENLPDSEWVRVRPAKSHWDNGFDVARPVVDSECVVTTCCLKTHGYGGVFTMSLKLSVGVTHKRNMTELHSSFRSMRKMIAEINQAYKPSLIVMDAIEAFVDGGPASGQRKRADLIIAGTDRIAIDAVGLAILKDLGSNDAIMKKKIFEQEQIARAVELGLGISSPQEIEFITDDNASLTYAEKLKGILLKG
ncbi:MAG: DUF362 domain-containing protein [Nitrospirota bacterium]|nr:DUF362 domain-containing protein [Nitrospirota bacterium]